VRFFGSKSFSTRVLLILASFRTLFYSVVFGTQHKLWTKGVGFRFDLLSPNKLRLSVGFSHSIVLVLPQFSTLIGTPVDKGQCVGVYGVNTVETGTIVRQLINFRYPNPYTGKGLKAFPLLSSFRIKPGKRTSG
jgi:ribosomal protein L6P/L9E